MKVLLFDKDGVGWSIDLNISNYIPETKFKTIQHYLQDFFQRNKPVTGLYKMYQCGSQLFDADKRYAGIFNLHYRNRYTKAVDLTLCRRNWLLWTLTKKIPLQSGKFRAFNNASIVDVVGEFTEKECEALWRFVGDRGGYENKVLFSEGMSYSHEMWLEYMTQKLKAKHPSAEQMDTFGTAICKRNRPDFVCHELLRRLEL